MIFLDTDIISYYFNANIKIKEKVFEAFDSGEKICVSVINVYEILRGFKCNRNKRKEDIFDGFLKSTAVFTIDDEVTDIASSIYANLKKIGKIIGDADILIAAVVMKNNGILVSNNVKHYENIDGLKLVNWSI